MRLFISDIHAGHTNPIATQALLRFLKGPARAADELNILGDLFDMWLGDDDNRDPHPEVVAALAACSGAGTAIHLLRGNHDFLLRDGFAQAAGVTLHDDPWVRQVAGQTVVLTHGDALCTDDLDYQALRHSVLDWDNQERFLAQAMPARIEEAAKLRAASKHATQLKAQDIMDVNEHAVRALLVDSGAALMIHGHTHRPARHQFNLNGKTAQRWVLAAWYSGASAIAWDAQGMQALGEEELMRLAPAG
ncbi:MAG: UDP-2,3-diacylglucosamine diphosphatase [Gammaproteobacteria bacterium]|nr:UDP-2,3-diacylglucosamine diphosphatase [Gammaproteobacteria bacterium]